MLLTVALLWIKCNLSYCECRTFIISEFGLAYKMSNDVQIWQALWMNLVKILLLFIKCCTGCVRPLHVTHEVIHFPLQPLLCLLQWSTLWVDSLNLLLWLLQALSKLLSAGWDNQHWEKENSDILRRWTRREFSMGEMGREGNMESYDGVNRGHR